MPTKGSIILTVVSAWVALLATLFTTDHFFSTAGMTIFSVCTIALSGAGYYYYWSDIKPKPIVPLYQKKSPQSKLRRVAWGIFTGFEFFEAIMMFLVVFLGFEFLVTNTGVVLGIALTWTNGLLVILTICGCFFLADIVRRFWKLKKKS